ncbi:MAG: LPS-assembly protein LptD [Firmicutes bacterium]|nr:LPS-assembly protein LptD [Bacillota bacterium]
MRSNRRLGGPPCKCRVTPSVIVILLTVIMWAVSGLLTGSAYAGESSAENSGIVIEADTTEYRFEPGGTAVVAEGNAKVSYKDFFVSADYIRVQVEPGELFSRGDVVACQGLRTVRCDLLAYNLYTGKGRILEPDAHISDLYIRGSEMNLAPGILTLDTAYVTGCELDYPCYRVSSKRLVIYPDDRVVAEWPVLWFENIPVMVLPRLVLPLRGDRIAFADGEDIPIPKFSHDSSDGFLVGLTYQDKIEDWVQVRYEGAYASKHRGIMLSAQADLVLGQGRTGALKGDYSSWKGFSVTAGYGMPLSDWLTLDARARYVPLGTGDDSTRWRGFEPGAVDGRLVVQSTDEWPVRAKLTVAKDILLAGDLYRIPELEVSLKPVSMPGNIGSVSLSGGFGRFEEPSRHVQAGRTHVAASFASSTIHLAHGITGSLSLGARRAWYETGDTLNSFDIGTSVKASLGEREAFGGTVPRIKAGINYDFRAVQGLSPFAFDKISPVNKASASMDYRVREDLSIGVSTSYDFRKQAIDDVGILLAHHNHCYDIEATWHKKQQTFGLEVKFTR